MSRTDRVKVTTVVAVDRRTAFRVFTEETDAWWKRGPRFRFALDREGVVRFEPGAGGRLLEVFDEASGDAYEVGRVLAWEPPARLAFQFRPRAFGPAEATEVHVRFETVEAGTRVTVEHRGWDAIPADHPARHGLVGPAFTGMMGLWWGEQLVAARSLAEQSSGTR